MAKKNMKIVLVACLFILCSAKVTSTRHDKLNWMNMDELMKRISWLFLMNRSRAMPMECAMRDCSIK